MNPYELAGRLLEKKLYLIQEGVNSSYLEDASNMLRQQADRIAELEKESANLEHSLKNALIFIDNAKQSEPVAWMDKYGNVCTNIQKKMYAGNITAQYNYDLNDIPLYTTPQTKPLSDEEISELSEKHLDMDWQTGVIEFARAIESKVRGQK